MLRIKSTSSSSQVKQYVPLKSISIKSKIRSFGADVVITQLFRNDETQPIEAVYCFPIEENAAIYSFVAKIDDREISAQLKEKQQAQQDYTQALQQGHAAYLMEQDEKSQDIFIINIGGLLPGKECQIEMKYVTELTLIDGNKIRFVLPTTIAPRYNPSVGGISSPANTQTNYVQSAPYTIDFQCQIDRSNQQIINSVSSPSHPIEIQFKENSYEIKFSQNKTSLDRDILLDIHLSNQQNTILALERYEENHLAIMTSFIPTKEDCQKLLKNNSINNEFIFVVDCSGSMQDENKIGLARQAMILFLKSLPINCEFNIIRFGSTYQPLFSQITKQYNEENVKQAEQLISSMSADLGGTELLKPLEWLHNQSPAINHSRQIFLLTDGEISNVNEVMDLCRTMSTSSRIFSFGLGHSPSRSLIKGLARTTNGRFTFIPPGTSVDIYVAEQLEKALEPCITNLKVKWNISSEYQSAPTVIPPVYANDRLLLYALIQNQQFNPSITIELWNQEETIRLGLATIDHIPEIIDDNKPLITYLAAKALIQEITHKKDVSDGSQQKRFKQNAEDNKKKQLIDISLKYSILCPHTAFIGIEKRINSSNDNMILREVPIQISADKSMLFPGVVNHCSLLLPPHISFARQACYQQQPQTQCLSFNMSMPPPPPAPSYTPYFPLQLQQQQQQHSMVLISPTCNINKAQAWPINDQDIVRHLINLQQFDGLWNLNGNDIQNLCRKSLTSFHSNLTQDSTILTTAIVMVALEIKFTSLKTMWSFVVSKARKRLIELLNNNENNLQQLINDIKKQL